MNLKFFRVYFLSFLLIFLILCPVLVFFFKVSFLQWPDHREWLSVLFWTFIQAFFSSVFSILFGIPGALGLCVLPKSRLWIYEGIYILPAMLPPLVAVLSWVNFVEFFTRFPFGFFSIGGIHVLINMGLVSVFLSRMMSFQSGLSQWAMVYNISWWSLLKKILFYELRKDLLLIFLLVFSFCFTSFSVPLLVGGSSGQTLEVLIAEKLKDPDLWPQAVSLFGVETLFIFFLFYILYFYFSQGSLSQKIFSNQKKFYFSMPTSYSISFLIIGFVPCLVLLIGLLRGFSLSAWQELKSIQSVTFFAWLQTLFLGVGVGGVVLVLLSWCAFCFQSIFLRRFLVAYTTGSVAFMGFCFLLIEWDHPLGVWFKWSVGLGLLFFPALYRLMGESLLNRLEVQVRLAHLMGASFWEQFIRIIWPQCVPTFFLLAGVAAFWATGDFAYSAITAGSQQNLALLIQDVFSMYRLELASILTLILLASGILNFVFFQFLGWMLNRMIQSS